MMGKINKAFISKLEFVSYEEFRGDAFGKENKEMFEVKKRQITIIQGVEGAEFNSLRTNLNF